MKKKKFLTFSLIPLLFIGSMLLVSLPTLNADSDNLTAHDPISIEHDGDINAANGVTNPDAAGTEEDPYIIENWSIDASNTHGIEITYTSKHFVIKNCEIKNGQNAEEEVYNNGIYIHTLQSGYCIVENNQLTKDNGGIVFNKASNCISRNNVFNDNGGNMRIYNCKDITIENNQAEDGGHGFYLKNVSDSTLKDNVVDGTYKPAYALYLSSSCIIDGNTVNDSEGGVYLYHSYDNTIKNNDIKECWSYGFATQDAPEGGQSSNNNQIYNNYFINNGVDKGVTQAYDKYVNHWSVGNTGNYWSDWQPPEHPDSNGDGVVDEDRPISGGSNEDNYPLVLPDGYYENNDDQDGAGDGDGNGDDGNQDISGDNKVDSGEDDSDSEGMSTVLIVVLIIAGGLAVAYPIYKKDGKKAVAVVVIIALVAGLGFYVVTMSDGSLLGDDGSGDDVDNGGESDDGGLASSTKIPLYSGSTKANLPSVVEADITGMFGEDELYDIYLVDASKDDVCSWYDTAMIDAGWSLPDLSPVTLSANLQANQGHGAQAFFKNGEIDASITVSSAENLKASVKYQHGIDLDISGTLIVLEADGIAESSSGSGSNGGNNGSSGSSGTGTTTDLPVYPGSSEKSVSSEVETALIYGCGGVPRDIYVSSNSLDAIKSWYKTQMATAGWDLSMEGDYEPDYRGKWYKDNKIATIWILTQEMITAQEMNYGVEIDLSGTVIVLSAWNEADCDF